VHIPKTELSDGNTVISSTILETPEDDQCWSKHVVCITSDVEEILTFKSYKVLKSKLHVRRLTGILKSQKWFV
jgi:hypothetical protein